MRCHFQPQVRPVAEDEMFRVVRSGKRKSKYSLHLELVIHLLLPLLGESEEIWIFFTFFRFFDFCIPHVHLASWWLGEFGICINTILMNTFQNRNLNGEIHFLDITLYCPSLNDVSAKQWKRMVTKVTFVGPGFTRKPPKYERFIRPSGLRFNKAHVTHPELKCTFNLEMIGVKKNPNGPMYTSLGVVTKGTIIEVLLFGTISVAFLPKWLLLFHVMRVFWGDLRSCVCAVNIRLTSANWDWSHRLEKLFGVIVVMG